MMTYTLGFYSCFPTGREESLWWAHIICIKMSNVLSYVRHTKQIDRYVMPSAYHHPEGVQTFPSLNSRNLKSELVNIGFLGSRGPSVQADSELKPLSHF